MADTHEFESTMNGQPGAVKLPTSEPSAVQPTADAGEPAASARHATAGRMGAFRRHQLIQEGRLYEQEHGLRRGRQRLRQLIQLGHLYEEEHGLRPARAKRGRGPRMTSEQLVATLFQTLTRLARPRHRAALERVARALEGLTEATPQPADDTEPTHWQAV